MTIRITKTKNGDKILQKVKENDGYCPCKPQRNGDTKCMCKEFRDKIDKREAGKCHCGLYEIEMD